MKNENTKNPITTTNKQCDLASFYLVIGLVLESKEKALSLSRYLTLEKADELASVIREDLEHFIDESSSLCALGALHPIPQILDDEFDSFIRDIVSGNNKDTKGQDTTGLGTISGDVLGILSNIGETRYFPKVVTCAIPIYVHDEHSKLESYKKDLRASGFVLDCSETTKSTIEKLFKVNDVSIFGYLPKELIYEFQDEDVNILVDSIIGAVEAEEDRIVSIEDPLTLAFVRNQTAYLPFFSIDMWKDTIACQCEIKDIPMKYAEWFFAFHETHDALNDLSIEREINIQFVVGSPDMYAGKQSAWEALDHALLINSEPAEEQYIEGDIFIETLQETFQENIKETAITLHEHEEKIVCAAITEFDSNDELVSHKNVYILNYYNDALDILFDMTESRPNSYFTYTERIEVCDCCGRLAFYRKQEDTEGEAELQGSAIERREQFVNFLRERQKEAGILNDEEVNTTSDEHVLESYRLCNDCGAELYTKAAETQALLEAETPMSAFEMLQASQEHEHEIEE